VCVFCVYLCVCVCVCVCVSVCVYLQVGRNVEARGMCRGGLELDKDNKELRQLGDQVCTECAIMMLTSLTRTTSNAAKSATRCVFKP
jgi:hypothetical protein